MQCRATASIFGIALLLGGCESSPLYDPSDFASDFDPGKLVEATFGIFFNKPPENALKGIFGFDQYLGKSAFVKSFHYVEKNELESTAAYAAAIRDFAEKALSKSDLVLADHPSSRGAMNDKSNDVILFYEGDKIEGSVKLFITPTDTGAIRVVGIICEHSALK